LESNSSLLPTAPARDFVARRTEVLRVLLWALVGLLAANIAIFAVVGDPLALYAKYRSEKLEMMVADPSTCSAAFGSSHVHNGFDPRAFDNEMNALGVHVRSLNLAIEGGSQGEQFLMAQRFLASRQTSASADRCLVILEANAGANFPEENLLHPRSINSYNFEVATISARFASPDLGLSRCLGRLAVTTFGTTMHYLNTGMLASRLFPHDLDADLLLRQTEFDRRGLLSEPMSEKDQADLLRAAQESPTTPRHVDGVLTQGHAALINSLRRRSHPPQLEFALLVTPKLSDLSVTEDYPACVAVGGQYVRVVDPVRPDSHPELYQQRYWHDVAHLNEAGAALFSKLVADAIRIPMRTGACKRI
jgi:hypothetical protein